MKHIGIIAEFNPFHNGHAYLIRSAKKRFPDKQIMSSAGNRQFLINTSERKLLFRQGHRLYSSCLLCLQPQVLNILQRLLCSHFMPPH